MALSCGEPFVPPAPYDALVDYVDCAGTYVDTGINLGDHTIIAEIQLSAGYVNNICLFGAWPYNVLNKALMVALYSNRYYFGTTSAEKNVAPAQPFDTNWHTYEISARGLFKVDNDVLYNDVQDAVFLNVPCYLFARYAPQLGTCPAGVRCRSFKIINNVTGTEVFDAVSARVGQIGYLYDRKSRQLLPGANANLTPGNDI